MRVRGERTPAALLRLMGRVALWALVALLLVRGAGAVMAGRPREQPTQQRARAAPVWPDDEVRAFAAAFARAYRSYLPGRPERYARGLARFMPGELVGAAVPRFAQHGGAQAVTDVEVARVARVDGRRALITVAVALAGEVVPRYLAVPVARDANGGLSVADVPSFLAPPAAGQLGPQDAEPVSGSERVELGDVLARFFRAYLAGDSDALRYLVPAGARVRALGQAFELVGVDSIAALSSSGGRRRVVLVGVRARDVRSRAIYPLRYRVALVRQQRWYVAAVNSTSREG